MILDCGVMPPSHPPRPSWATQDSSDSDDEELALDDYSPPLTNVPRSRQIAHTHVGVVRMNPAPGPPLWKTAAMAGDIPLVGTPSIGSEHSPPAAMAGQKRKSLHISGDEDPQASLRTFSFKEVAGAGLNLAEAGCTREPLTVTASGKARKRVANACDICRKKSEINRILQHGKRAFRKHSHDSIHSYRTEIKCDGRQPCLYCEYAHSYYNVGNYLTLALHRYRSSTRMYIRPRIA